MVTLALMTASALKADIVVCDKGQKVKLSIKNMGYVPITIIDPDEVGIQHVFKLMKQKPGREADRVNRFGVSFEHKLRTATIKPGASIDRKFALDVDFWYVGEYRLGCSYNDKLTAKQEGLSNVSSKEFLFNLEIHPQGTYSILETIR